MGLWSGLSRLLGGAPARLRHAPVPRQRGGGWASLPPIQRAVGQLELTARSTGFVRRLPGASRLELSARPLGHERLLDAPGGLVDLAGPITAQAWPDRSPLPFWRRPPRQDIATGGAEAWAGEDVPVAPVEDAAVEPQAGQPLLVEPRHGEPQPVELERGQPLPVLGPRPVQVVQPAPATGGLTKAPGAFALEPSRVKRPQEAEIPTGGGGLDVPTTLPSPSEGGGDDSPAWNAPLLPAQRLNLGQSRRHGLVHPSIAAQRSTEPAQPDTPGPDGSSGPAQFLAAREDSSTPAPAASGLESGVLPALGPAERPAAIVNNPLRPSSAQSVPVPGTGTPGAPADDASEPSPGLTQPPPLQALRDRPVPSPSAPGIAAPIFRVQRQAGAGPSHHEHRSLGVAPAVRQVPIVAGDMPEPGQAGTESFEPGPPPARQRQPAVQTEPSPMPVEEPQAPEAAAFDTTQASESPPAMPLAAISSPHPGVRSAQRLPGEAAAFDTTQALESPPAMRLATISSPHAAMASAQRLPGEAAASAAPTLLPLAGGRPMILQATVARPAGPQAPGPTPAPGLAPLPPPVAATSAGPASLPSHQDSWASELPVLPPAVIVNRLPEEPVTMALPAPATVQRQAPQVVSPGPAISGPPVATAEPPAVEAAATPKSDQQLDDLAGKLYDRFRARFRMELLIDRERAGLITDLR